MATDTHSLTGLSVAVIDAVGESIVVVDDTGQVTHVNEPLSTLLESDRQALIDRPITDILSDQCIDVSLPQLRELADRPETDRVVRIGDHSLSMRATRISSKGNHYLVVVFRESPVGRHWGPDEECFERLSSAANEAILVFDPLCDRILDCNKQACSLLGYSRDRLLTMAPAEILTDEERFRSFLDQIDECGQAWTDQLSCQTTWDTAIPVEVSGARVAVDDQDCVVASVRAILEQTVSPMRLDALTESTRKLMSAETPADISEIGLSAVSEYLPCEIAAIRRFDHTANTLELTAMTEEARSLIDSWPAYDLEATDAGRAYRRGEPVTNHAGQIHDYPSRRTYASLHVPLLEYGTLTVLAESAAEVSQDVVKFLRLLGTTLGTAFERVEREQRLRQHREELTRVDGIDTVVRETVRSVLRAVSRDEIEATICQRLTDSSLSESAWIGGLDSDTGEIAPRASAGVDTDPLEAIGGLHPVTVDLAPAIDAVDSGTVRSIRRYRAPESDVASPDCNPDDPTDVLVAVPLTYGPEQYGVLIVNRSKPVDRRTREAFEFLGDTAAFAITAVRNRQLLLSNRAVELKFELQDPAHPIVALAARLDCECQLEVTRPLKGGRIRSYLRVQGGDAEEAVGVLEGIDGVQRVEILGETSEDCRLEVVRTDPLSRDLARIGTTVVSAIGRGGMGTVVLQAPQRVDAREVVDTFTDRYPEAELIAKREREPGTGTVPTIETIDEELTERQRSVLETAYETGYFAWPRESTAEEVAEDIGISSPTLHQHIRTAERKLLSALFEDNRT